MRGLDFTALTYFNRCCRVMQKRLAMPCGGAQRDSPVASFWQQINIFPTGQLFWFRTPFPTSSSSPFANEDAILAMVFVASLPNSEQQLQDNRAGGERECQIRGRGKMY